MLEIYEVHTLCPGKIIMLEIHDFITLSSCLTIVEFLNGLSYIS